MALTRLSITLVDRARAVGLVIEKQDKRRYWVPHLQDWRTATWVKGECRRLEEATPSSKEGK